MFTALPSLTAPAHAALTNPFDECPPHPLAQHAMTALQDELRAGAVISPTLLEQDGKMFGVLVVRTANGELGYLRAFSGMLDGRWQLPGFVPPIFDAPTRSLCERQGDARVRALSEKIARIEADPERLAARATLQAFAEKKASELAALRDHLQTRKHARKQKRATADADTRAALDRESCHDSGERARTEHALAQKEATLTAATARWESELRAAEHARRTVCAELMAQIHDTYVIRNARGETCTLRSLFAPSEPPSGAGDCAAPKLLAYAFAHGLQPLALAEFYWGAPPLTGGRLSGVTYPACKTKCGPLLPFMWQGLAVAEGHAFAPPVTREEGLRIVFEDAWIVVIDKPAGLLSVPGRHAAHKDSVLTRLRARYPHATGPLLVHRLDLDTSGLLVAAKDAAGHTLLQKQFARREVKKRYAAIVEGAIAHASGAIDFPIRPDIDDRPRQIRDLTYGRPALTEWQVVKREGERTRIAFFPVTGRSHQLRVHAAHPLGLGAPIVGDRLYGHRGGRLLLHAEALTFTHPHTGASQSFESPAPF